MDGNTAIQAIINQAPSIAFAVWFVVRQQKTIDSLLDNQSKLLDRLLGYVDKDKQAAAQIVSKNQVTGGD